MTLGFGTTLIGEAVDYAIYYLVQSRGGGAERWRRESWPTVRLGLFTSLIGFAALVFTGFPGLAQLGVFSIAGLAAAAATTRFVFPDRRSDRCNERRLSAPARALHGRRMRVAAALAARRRGARARRTRCSRRRSLAVARRAVGTEPRARVRARARRGLARRRRRCRRGHAGRGRGSRRAGRARRVPRRSALASTRSSIRVSSPATTRRRGWCRRRRRRRAGAPRCPTLRRSRHVSPQATADGPAAGRAPRTLRRRCRRRPHPAPSIAHRSRQRRSRRRSTPCCSPAPRRDRGERSSTCRRARARCSTSSACGPRSATSPARASSPSRPSSTRSTRATCAQPSGRRRSARSRSRCCSRWQLRSARRLADVAVPIAAATLVVLAVLALSGAALGILHLVGLLLTVAIGSNYALFFDHLRERDEVDADTLASLLLANLTTVASFGLLASSRIPVLQAVGIVVAPGTLLCLVFSAAWLGRGDGARRRAWEDRTVSNSSEACCRARAEPAPPAVAGVRNRLRGLARRRRRRRARRARGVAMGARRDRRQPCGAHRRRPLAAFALARPQLDTPAARRDRAPRDRDHDRRRSRSGGDAGRARPARRARRARDLLLHRRPRARARGPVPRDRRARPQRAEPQRSPPAHVLAARPERDAARDRRRPGDDRRHRRRGAALLPRSRRAAQSVPRAGAAPTRPAARELDPARLRHGAARRTGRARAPRRADSRRATSCSLHDGNAARTADGVPVVLAALPALLERVRALGLRRR